MYTDSADTSWMWLAREGMVPVIALAVIVWIASVDLSVVSPWSSAPIFGNGEPAETTRSTPSGRTPSVPLVLPVASVPASDLVDTFEDARSGGRTHHAIDIMAPSGTPVVAAAEGTVMRRRTGGLGGKSLYVVSPDTSFVYYYAHLAGYADRAAEGMPVDVGDRLGVVGATGNAESPHLHFAIWAVDDLKRPWARHPVNPYPLLRGG